MSEITLDQLTEAVNALKQRKEQVAACEILLKDAKESERILSQETIPGMMHQLGVHSIKLETGETISIAFTVYGSISNNNREAATQWLKDNKFDGIIKTKLVTDFGRGELERAQIAAELLAEQGLTSTATESVHAQTLKAFLKDELSKGTKIPMNLFSAYTVWETKVK